MVFHGVTLYDLVYYVIYFFRFVGRAVCRKMPIPLIFYSKNILKIFSSDKGMVFASLRELFSRLSPPVNPLLASSTEENIWNKLNA